MVPLLSTSCGVDVGFVGRPMGPNSHGNFWSCPTRPFSWSTTPLPMGSNPFQTVPFPVGVNLSQFKFTVSLLRVGSGTSPLHTFSLPLQPILPTSGRKRASVSSDDLLSPQMSDIFAALSSSSVFVRPRGGRGSVLLLAVQDGFEVGGR